MTHEHFDSQLLSPTSNLDCVLDGLAERINTLNDASLSAIRSSFEHAAECGKLLIEAKELVGHGGWSGC